MSNTQTAIITGAGGAIGRVTARLLAQQGWLVIVNDIDEAAAQQTAELVQRQQGKAIVSSGDVGDSDSVERVFADIDQRADHPPALLINNVGVQTWASVDELTVADWQRTINTNLNGCFYMTRCFSARAPRGSSIINIGSGCNKLAFPRLIDYTAAKGGIEMFTKATAVDLGPRGIRVNCIAPGAIETERTANETGNYSERWAELTPLQRVGTPTDIANAVMLLVDERASFITGQTINVDGGLFSRAPWPADY